MQGSIWVQEIRAGAWSSKNEGAGEKDLTGLIATMATHGTDVAVLLIGRPPAPRNRDSIGKDSTVHVVGSNCIELMFDSESFSGEGPPIRKGNQMKRPTCRG